MRETIDQFLKYGIVGVCNTLITAVVIWILMKCTPATDVEANAVGYIAGLINSFVLNKKWTFHSKGRWTSGAVKFLVVFAVCYMIQLGFLVFILEPYLDIDPFYKQLLAMGLYTVINFIMNKFYTFNHKITEEA
jgi:putative flippase GtrA